MDNPKPTPTATDNPPVNLLDVITAGRTLPDGATHWGVKSVHPDLRTYDGYRWPYPGQTAQATDPDPTNTDACPAGAGDGLCVAWTWQGMATGGIPARTLLLVAYNVGNVLGRDDTDGKLRTAGVVHVVDLVDGQRLLREHGAGANLTSANLHGANLTSADLSRANLHGADLRGANLSGANLHGADLRGADLSRANLRGADLRGADLRGANLHGADLRGANLSGANLTSADLSRADLRGADLSGANLHGADLRGADLNQYIRWPDGFDFAAAVGGAS